ncbi:hypothetical protein SMD11_0360 [Streptomyces albireticuli]|uniref:Uncharacterized protein n=2 Tax=Streptomyces TaxID=1883 RepID=A0A1Z2KVI9_9ACTN|nr:hypothetical protein SMD11_0360 [Streptomyces albireticuli]MBB5122089.1 hypothetical protein [Streptomyces eurocidicus]
MEKDIIHNDPLEEAEDGEYQTGMRLIDIPIPAVRE